MCSKLLLLRVRGQREGWVRRWVVVGMAIVRVVGGESGEGEEGETKAGEGKGEKGEKGEKGGRRGEKEESSSAWESDAGDVLNEGVLC